MNTTKIEMPTRVSKYVTFGEAIKSQTAERFNIDNYPDIEDYTRMQNVAKNIFDKVREYIGKPLGVSSFFRSPDLNLAIGGSTTSQHMKGEAIDIDCDMFGNGTNKNVFDFIRNELEFDQLIWEFGSIETPAWVHVSLSFSGKNRKQVLRAYRWNNKTKYEKFDLY